MLLASKPDSINKSVPCQLSAPSVAYKITVPEQLVTSHWGREAHNSDEIKAQPAKILHSLLTETADQHEKKTLSLFSWLYQSYRFI